MKNIFSILGENYKFNPDTALFVDVSLKDQILYEDIIQITNKNNSNDLCVDIGWYGGDVETGYFRIVVIKDEDWEKPIYSKTARSVEQLEIYLKQSLAYLKV